MKKNLFLLLSFIFLISYSTDAQNLNQDYWSATKESNIKQTGKRQIIPQKYLTFKVSEDILRHKLSEAPLDSKVKIQVSPCIISLPTADGTLQRFRVVESPVMAPELSAAFPGIKTFNVLGVDDVYASGKIDWNEFGFHGMIFSPNGDYYIDPYCLNNTADYIVYYKDDFIKDPTQVHPEVGVIKEGAPEPEKKSTGSVHESRRPAAVCVGAQLRTYRLAVACTGEYAAAATGSATPTNAQILSKVATSVSRVSGVYEKEIAVKLVLVPSTTLILFSNSATDPFTGNANNDPNSLINLSQSIITATIGSGNFDLGHTFSTGAGGLAQLACVCINTIKARGVTGSANPVGDPYDIDYVAHEMGHQFGGGHTFNAITGSCSGNRDAGSSVEPGGGVTIMAYAGICGSNNVAGNSIPYFHAISYDEIVTNTYYGSGSACPVVSSTGNLPPVVTTSGNYFIPKSTPFILSGSAVDPNSDPMTYSWEEMDPGTGTGGNWNSGQKPFFRSYAPVTIPTRLFPRQSVVNSNNYTGTIGEYLPTTGQTLNFRLTARDNNPVGGGVCYSGTQVQVDTSGPLVVTYPSAVNIGWLINSQKTITWDPNFTDQPPVSCDSVRVLISYNSGVSYSVLVNSVANYGWCQITVPTLSATISTCRIKVESIGNIFYDIGNNDFTISTDPYVGISEISENNPLSLHAWPNPSSGVVLFSANNLKSTAKTEVLLFDLLGRELMSKSFDKQTEIKSELNLSALENGIYFIRLRNDGNQASHRIIKE